MCHVVALDERPPLGVAYLGVRKAIREHRWTSQYNVWAFHIPWNYVPPHFSSVFPDHLVCRERWSWTLTMGFRSMRDLISLIAMDSFVSWPSCWTPTLRAFEKDQKRSLQRHLELSATLSERNQDLWLRIEFGVKLCPFSSPLPTGLMAFEPFASFCSFNTLRKELATFSALRSATLFKQGKQYVTVIHCGQALYSNSLRILSEWNSSKAGMLWKMHKKDRFWT